MVGVGVFTTGFNYRPVDCIVVLRPTVSPVLWCNYWDAARAQALRQKTNCLVLDFAANTPPWPRK